MAEPNPARTVRLLVVGDTDPTGARMAALRDLGVEVTVADPSPLAGVRAGLALRRSSGGRTVVEVPFPGPTLGAWLAARLARAPLVVRVRDTASAAPQAGGSALRRASLVVTASRSAAAALAAAMPELAGRIVAEPPGVEIDRFRHEGPHPPGEAAATGPPVAVEHRRSGVVFVGPLTAGGGVDLLLDAMGTIEADGRPPVTIIGQGAQLEALRAQAERLEINAAWHSDGEQERIVHALRSAAIVVVPPGTEPDATTTIQGMAAGAVVVATASGSLREIVDDGRNGILVEPLEPAALVAGIRRALIVARGEDRLRLMRIAAAATAADHDVRVVARRTLDRYEALRG